MESKEGNILPSDNHTPPPVEIVSDIDNSQEALKSMIIAQYQQLYSGPLPPPELLAAYEKTLPGFSDRIVRVFEDSAKHGRDMEKNSLDSAIRYADKGQNRGFIVTVFGLAIGMATAILSLLLLSNGAAISGIISGSAVSGISILKLVSKFIDGPRNGGKSDNR